MGQDQIKLAKNRIEESIGAEILRHPEAFGLAINNGLSPSCLLALFQTLYEKGDPKDYLLSLTAAQMLQFLEITEKPERELTDEEFLNPPYFPRITQLTCDQKNLVVHWINEALTYHDFNPNGHESPKLLLTAMHYGVESAGLRELFAIHFPNLELPEFDDLPRAIHQKLAKGTPNLSKEKAWLLLQVLMGAERYHPFSNNNLCEHIANFPKAEEMELDGRLELLTPIITKSKSDQGWTSLTLSLWVEKSDCSRLSTSTKVLIFYFFLTLKEGDLPSNFVESLHKEEASAFKEIIDEKALETYCSILGDQASFLS